MVMAIPLANKAGKFATLAEVTFPPAVLEVERLEEKSYSHYADALGQMVTGGEKGYARLCYPSTR